MGEYRENWAYVPPLMVDNSDKEDLKTVIRVACELAHYLKRGFLFADLSRPTLQWVRKHEQVDYQRRKK